MNGIDIGALWNTGHGIPVTACMSRTKVVVVAEQVYLLYTRRAEHRHHDDHSIRGTIVSLMFAAVECGSVTLRHQVLL